MSNNNKYIVTEVHTTDNKTFAIFESVALDKQNPLDTHKPKTSVSSGDLKVGDIIDDKFLKKYYKDCEPAIVTGNHSTNTLNFVTAFCAKYGDIAIELKSPFINQGFPNPYIYTQRGDEILVRKKSDNKFEIVTNKTIDKLRSDFLQKQK